MSEDLIVVQNLIYEIRGQKVMLDFDLARLYQVGTGCRHAVISVCYVIPVGYVILVILRAKLEESNY